MTDALAASIGVLVVDDHQLFAAGLARLLADEPDITVLGMATSGAQALEMVDRLQPQVVLTERRADADLGVDGERAAVAFGDQGVGNREPLAGPLADALGSEERVEQPPGNLISPSPLRSATACAALTTRFKSAWLMSPGWHNTSGTSPRSTTTPDTTTTRAKCPLSAVNAVWA